MVEFRVLGPLEVTDGTQRVPPGGPKERALLALLLLEPGRVVSLDRLVEEVWEGDPPESATLSVRVMVSKLRKALGAVGAAEAVVTRAPGYLLDVDAATFDAARFEVLLERGRAELASGAAPTAAATLREALGLWRGAAYADVADSPFARGEAARLEEARLAALEERIEADLACGRPEVVVGELEALCAVHPLRERLWGQRMVALYRCGRQAEALRTYQDLRAVLADELGLDPSPELVALEGRILAQDASLGASALGGQGPGAPRNAGLPSGVITFLLTDIEGSTSLWDSQPDAMAAALEGHDRLVASVIHGAGGQVVKSKGEGDALLAVFQRASEAVTAALEVQRALAAQDWPAGVEMRVRMGVHTGEAHERDGDYFGPTLNRAARLRGLASGGQILLSRVTADLVRDRLPDGVSLVDLGARELRGLSRDEQVFDLVERGLIIEEPAPPDMPIELALPGPVAAAARGFFVGREDEVGIAGAAWARVVAGERHTLLVSGEPGIGKTRLACETARHAHGEGALVLFGRCDEDLGVPYQPFAEALASFVAACPPDQLAASLGELGGELSRIVPDIARRCPSLPPPMQVDSANERVQLFDAVNGWLVELARRASGVVLVLDDLHWAAAPTLALLRHLARVSDSSPVLMVGTYRHTDLDRAHALADMLADLRRHEGVERLALRGLDADGAAAFVEGFAGQELADAERDMARVLHDETEGNPFFMAEVLRHLVESGAVRRDEGRWVASVSTVADAGLPEGIREVIGRRLSRLSPATNQALAVASVVGPSFSLNLLERVPDVLTDAAASLLDALDEAVRAGVLNQAPGGYAFAHALVRQSVYGELTSARRARLHRHVGEAIEELPDAETQVAALAHHFAEAALDGQIAKATHYALAAADRAIEQLAFEEAVSIAERALALLALEPAPEVARRADLRLLLASARWGLGDRHAASEMATGAFDDAMALGSGNRAARAVVIRAALSDIYAVDPSVEQACFAALDLLGEDEVVPRSRVLAALARHYAMGGMRNDLAVAPAAEALELARRSGEPALISAALSARLYSLSGSGQVDEELALVQELVELGRDSNDGIKHGEALLMRLSCRLAVGDVEGMRVDLEALREWATRGKSTFVVSMLMGAEAGIATIEGRFDVAEAEATAALRRGGDDQVIWAVVSNLYAQLLYQRGRFHEARTFIDEIGEHYPQAPVEAPLAFVDAQLGDAERLHRLADTDLAEVVRGVARALILAWLAQACALVAETGMAEVVEHELLAFRGQLIGTRLTTITVGATDRFLGMLAARGRRWDEAETLYRSAMELEARFESPVFLADSSLWYGRMLLERDGPGDREHGVERLTTALTTAEEIGMAWVAQEARRLLRPPLPQPLKPREGTTFVGRTAELARLADQWHEVQAGARRLVLVAGEPGIGKTRLAGEFAAGAHGEGATVLYGRCDDEAGTAYQPFAEALRAYVAACPADELTAHVARFGADVARLVPELARRVPELPDVTTSDLDSERLRLFDAITGMLAAASSRAPVVLVLDDLHWATRPTLLLLRHLLRSSEPMRLLLVATYRDTDLDRAHPLANALTAIQREGAGDVQRLVLRGLDAGDVAAYVEGAGGQALGEDELALAKALHTETEGNPFFVAEVLRHLVETGAAYRQDDRWVLKSGRIEDLGLPEGVRDVITQRLSRLSDNANRVLAVASVVGPSFSLRVLEGVPDAAPSGDELIDALDETLASGIVLDGGATGYSFAHALIRQTLYSELSSARRTRLHRRIGEAIEALFDADRHLDALAHHFAEAAIDGQAAKAASYALSAGQAAMDRLAFEEAVSVFERGLAALELGSADDLSLRTDLLLALSSARWVAGDRAGARQAASHAAADAEAMGSAERLARAAILLTSFSEIFFEDPATTSACRAALEALGNDHAALRARVLAGLSRYQSGSLADGELGRGTAEEALALARQAGEPGVLRAALYARIFSLFGASEIAEQLTLSDELIALARQADDVGGLCDGLIARISFRLGVADLAGARSDLDEATDIATGQQLWRRWPYTTMGRAGLAIIDGRFADADAILDRVAIEIGRDPVGFTNYTGCLLVLHRERGQVAAMHALATAGLERVARAVAVKVALAMLDASLGNEAAARKGVAWAVEGDLAAVPRDPLFPITLAFLAEACALVADAGSAAAVERHLKPFAGDVLVVTLVPLTIGAADRYLGMLAATQRHWDEAEAYYLSALALDERLESRPLATRTRLWYARMLLARDEEGDTQRANDLLKAALAAADELGIEDIAVSCREHLTQ